MSRIVLSCVTWMSLPYFSILSHNRYDFRKRKVTEHNIRVLIFSTNVVWNISHSKKNAARYYSICTYVFMQCTRNSWHIVIKLELPRQFLTFCWPCISVHLSRYLTNLMHKICFTIRFYFMPLHVSSTCAHHTYRCDDTRGCVMQFWPPDDEHMCSKHVAAWNKTYCETNFVHQVG